MISKPWLNHYDAEVPDHLDYPPISLDGFLLQQSMKNPARIAIICDGKNISYEELYDRSLHFSLDLIIKGLKPGKRVAICLPNSIDFVVAFYGTLMAGGVVAAMNPSYPLVEWQFQIEIAKPDFLIGLSSRTKDLNKLRQNNRIKNLILVETSNDEVCTLDWMEVNFAPEQADHYFPHISPDSPALMQFSGGTTGLPKAALILHRNVVANVCQFKQWLTTLHEGEEVFLTAIPLYHVYGMVIGLNVGIALGATIVLAADGRDVETTLKLIEKHRVTFFPGVPSMYNAINQHPRVRTGEVDLRSIKACISGSAPLLHETRVQFEALTGGKLVEGYGLSEAPTATHCNPIQGENRDGSIGLPLPDVDCRIVDLEDPTCDVKNGETGELLIRSPQIMKEYYDSPEETRIALEDDWLHTGDIVSMDKDGYFYIAGRKKELIKVNGLQVWPSEVENVLLKFPGVLEAAAAGIEDRDTGEAVKAWLVMKAEEPFEFYRLVDFCKVHLASYKIPKEVEIVEALPKSTVGKILRRELVRMHIEQKKRSGA